MCMLISTQTREYSMDTGIIFDVQRFSVHDGPGIRTTIFMKGCPLHCRWCHNPEGINLSPQLRFFEEKCIGCGRCGTKDNFDDAFKCPSKALVVCGKEVTSKEILFEILKDKNYYKNNGGVTFSGGECLLQADFVSDLLALTKSYGIHTAIDTCGCVPWSEIEKTVDNCDLYLYDIKCMDSQLHKNYTGVENVLILDNLVRLDSLGKNIWIRIPIIPGFNNTEEEMTKIAEFISTLSSVKQVTLIPYNTLGVNKYKTLGLEYDFDIFKRIEKEEICLFESIFKSRNIFIA